MAYSDANISGVTLTRLLGAVLVSWSSTEPDGTVYQVYVDGVHVATTTGLSVAIPPGVPGRSRTIDVGAVDSDEGEGDLAADLAAAPTTGDRAVLTWYGGTYLSDTIEGFRIYRSAAAGGAVSYAAAVGTVPAYAAGVILDGAGLGRAGGGGAGRSEAAYRWVSDPLGTGTWRFGVAAYDQAGNQVASPSEYAIDVVALPKPPAADKYGRRITYVYNSGTGEAALAWQPGV